MQTGIVAAEIRSGDFGDGEVVQNYHCERLGEMLVERVIWGRAAPSQRRGDAMVSGPGYVWFRFWMLSDGQVIERYYGEHGQLIGTQIDVCMPPIFDEGAWRAKDLHLDIWVTPEGRVTLSGETAFDEAAEQGELSRDEVQYAEEQVRTLTAGIVQGRFPPPVVRRWQVDPSRIHSMVAERIRDVRKDTGRIQEVPMSADSNAQPSDVSGLVAELGNSDGLARQRAREALVDIGQPTVPALRTALISPHEQVRWEAAKALSEIAAPESAPGLVTALEDREFSVRWIAAEGLVAIGHRSVEPLLEALVARGDRQWLREGAHHVLKALSKRGSYEAIAPMLAALEGMEPELVVPPAAKAALKSMRSSD